MAIFDIEDYTLPSFEFVDWVKTKEAMGIFLQTFKVNRERIGLSACPQLTNDGLLKKFDDPIKKKNRNLLTEHEKAYLQTEACFFHAFTAIMHPYRPEVTERRRRVFFYRYLYGLSILAVSERVHFQRNIIINDSKMAIIQFALALDLLFYE